MFNLYWPFRVKSLEDLLNIVTIILVNIISFELKLGLEFWDSVNKGKINPDYIPLMIKETKVMSLSTSFFFMLK